MSPNVSPKQPETPKQPPPVAIPFRLKTRERPYDAVVFMAATAEELAAEAVRTLDAYTSLTGSEQVEFQSRSWLVHPSKKLTADWRTLPGPLAPHLEGGGEATRPKHTVWPSDPARLEEEMVNRAALLWEEAVAFYCPSRLPEGLLADPGESADDVPSIDSI